MTTTEEALPPKKAQELYALAEKYGNQIRSESRGHWSIDDIHRALEKAHLAGALSQIKNKPTDEDTAAFVQANKQWLMKWGDFTEKEVETYRWSTTDVITIMEEFKAGE